MHILNINCLGLGPNSSKIFCNFRWSYPHSGQSLTKVAFERQIYGLLGCAITTRRSISYSLELSSLLSFMILIVSNLSMQRVIFNQSLGNLWAISGHYLSLRLFFAALSNERHFSLVSANTFSFVPKLIVNKIWDWILWVHNAVLASL